MASFYWSIGPVVGSAQVMVLTIAGEVGRVAVTSSADSGGISIAPTGFQPCIGYQTLQIGPVPLSFLPLIAAGTDCPADGGTPIAVPSATSQSPTDSMTTGMNPFCAALTGGGIVLTTVDGGGTTDTPQDKCAAAQNSADLASARSAFESACSALRSDQALVTAYAAVTAVAAALAAAFFAAAIVAVWPFNVVLALAFAACLAVALIFLAYTIAATSDVGADEALLDGAQRAWEAGVAAVKNACCAAWITVNTADLVCP